MRERPPANDESQRPLLDLALASCRAVASAGPHAIPCRSRRPETNAEIGRLPLDTRWPMPAMTPGRCRRGSATRTSSTRWVTPSWRRTGSRISGVGNRPIFFARSPRGRESGNLVIAPAARRYLPPSAAPMQFLTFLTLAPGSKRNVT